MFVETQSPDAARAQTDLGAETTAPAPTQSKPRAGLAFAVVGFVLVAAAGGAYLTFNRAPSLTHQTEPTASAAAVAPAGQPALPVASEAAPAPSPLPAAQSSPSPAPSAPAVTGVRLSVTTEPDGAVVLKNGFQVCDTTPCEVLATPNETLELEGKKGGLRGKAKVLAQRDQKVTIKLAAAAAPKPQGPAMCEVIVDDLKILRPCP